jgi:hypothetical protein
VALLIDFLCHNGGGRLPYTGRNMNTVHVWMHISEVDRVSEADRDCSIGHVRNALGDFDPPEAETSDVLSCHDSTKSEIVQALYANE